jgi:hypothetical protein
MNIKRVAFEVKPVEKACLNLAPKCEKQYALYVTRRRTAALLFAALMAVAVALAVSAAMATDAHTVENGGAVIRG